MKIITYSDIENAWINTGTLAVFQPLDEAYGEPTEEWFARVFNGALADNLFDQGLSKYDPESNDCDDAAVNSWSQYRVMHSRTIKQQGLPKCGADFGIMTYTKTDMGPHMINWTCINGVIRPYEPQRQQFVTLTEEEYATVNLIIA